MVNTRSQMNGETHTWRGRPVPPVLAAWFDQAMGLHYVNWALLEQGHVDLTLRWYPGGVLEPNLTIGLAPLDKVRRRNIA